MTRAVRVGALLKWFGLALAGGALLAGASLAFCRWYMLDGPHELAGAAPRDYERERRLAEHVYTLAGAIGERNVGQPKNLEAAHRYLRKAWRKLGLAPVSYGYELDGVICNNVECDVPGRDRQAAFVAVGAHYDSVPKGPGADDNASGVAALLEMTRAFVENPPRRTIRLLAFVNEEDPYFQTPRMGSEVYARMARSRNDRLYAMIALDSLGYFSSAPGSQSYPAGLGTVMPDRGDFLAVVSNLSGHDLVRRFRRELAPLAGVPTVGASVFASIEGIDWSDHQSFWKVGYPALMVTDTAVDRNPHYHKPDDEPRTLDYVRLSSVTAALEHAIAKLANE